MLSKRPFRFGLSLLCFLTAAGCTAGSPVARERSWGLRNTPTEAQWIRNGEPLIFEGEQWFPADSIENLLESEVYPVGEYKEVQIFVEFTDVRPFYRLYTRFNKNKFRFFERKKQE